MGNCESKLVAKTSKKSGLAQRVKVSGPEVKEVEGGGESPRKVLDCPTDFGGKPSGKCRSAWR